MVMYLENVFRDSGISWFDPHLAPVLVGAARTVTALVSPFVMHRCRKRVLFPAACVGVAAGLALVALPATVVVGAVVAMVCHTLSVIPTLHILVAEVFPTDVRSVAVGAVNLVNASLAVVCVRSYPAMVQEVGFPVTMFCYSANCLLMACWGAIKIKDVDGLSLVGVERLYGATVKENNTEEEEQNKLNQQH